MDNTRQHNYQNIFSKWLFAAILLMSFFSFSGLIVQTQTKPNALKTTLVIGNKTRVVKSITFNRAFGNTHGKLNSLSFLTTPAINLVYVHSRLVKTRIICLDSGDISSLSNYLFYQHKPIPQSAGDESTYFL